MLFRQDSGCGCGPTGSAQGGYMRSLDKRFLVPGPYQANMLGALANLGPRFAFSGHPGYATTSGIHQPGAIRPIQVSGTVGAPLTESVSFQNVASTAAVAFGTLMAAGVVGKNMKGFGRLAGFALMALGFFGPSIFGGQAAAPAAPQAQPAAQG